MKCDFMVAFLPLALNVSHPDPYKLESALTDDGRKKMFSTSYIIRGGFV